MVYGQHQVLAPWGCFDLFRMRADILVFTLVDQGLQRINQIIIGKVMTTTTRFTIRQLLEAGVHFGHKKNHWNPKMAPYIFGVRHGVHIIDLQLTAGMLHEALEAMKNVAAQNGKILFVSTKKQAGEYIAEHATRCGQYFVNHRWLGGMLTNWNTVSASINTLREYESKLNEEDSKLTKKERLDLSRKKDKLERVLGGIREMNKMPSMLFVIDAEAEALAITEANKLGIPVVAIVDTNTSPDGISYVVPGNDDARKAIELYCQLASDAVLEGMQESLTSSGVDIGASENLDNADLALTFGASEEAAEEKAEPVASKPVAPKKAAASKAKKSA